MVHVLIFYAKRIFYPEDILCLCGLPVDVYLICKRTSLLGRGQSRYTATEDLLAKTLKGKTIKTILILISSLSPSLLSLLSNL